MSCFFFKSLIVSLISHFSGTQLRNIYIAGTCACESVKPLALVKHVCYEMYSICSTQRSCVSHVHVLEPNCSPEKPLAKSYIYKSVSSWGKWFKQTSILLKLVETNSLAQSWWLQIKFVELLLMLSSAKKLCPNNVFIR